MKLIMTGLTAGTAKITIDGEVPTSDIDIAIQRAGDQCYISEHATWGAQTWHRLHYLSEDKMYLAPATIVDALVEVMRSETFRATIRWDSAANWDAGEITGGLIIRTELIASEGLLPPPSVDRPPPQPPSAPAQPSIPQAKKPIWPWILGLVLVLLLTLGLISALQPTWLGLSHDVDSTAQSPSDSALQGDSDNAASADQLNPKLQEILEQAEANGLRGSELVAKIENAQLSGEDVLTATETIAKQGDCAAVIQLYALAANTGDPDILAQVARLYDTKDFAPSDCLQEPSRFTAIDYYTKAKEAAEAGGDPVEPEVLWRLGELEVDPNIRTGSNNPGLDLMLEAQQGGYDAGLDALKDATKKGDSDAQIILEELERRRNPAGVQETPGVLPLDIENFDTERSK